MKTKPSKQAKRRQKTVLNGTNGTVKKPKENPETLLLRATTLLQQSQPEEALQNALRGLKYLQRQTSAPDSKDVLDAMLLVAEIYLELGDMENAREHFSKAVEFDPEGRAGSEAYLWMAQLSEEGGPDSIRWFEEALKILRREVGELEGQQSPEAQVLAAEKKVKMADALCSMTEIYMTDLSWEEDAETRCETYVTEALLVAPNSPEPLQTLASIRISQLRPEDARASLTRSIELWKDLPPEDPGVPDFATRISLARLLMEVEMASEALEVLERLILEDDQSVEAWYLGGWCSYLIGQAESGREPGTGKGAVPSEDSAAAWKSSRAWLKNGLKLYALLDYEDEPLRTHAEELVEGLNKELGETDTEDEWEDEEEAGDEDENDEVENGLSDDEDEPEDTEMT